MKKFLSFLFALLVFGGSLKAQTSYVDVDELLSIGDGNTVEIEKGNQGIIPFSIQTNDKTMRTAEFHIIFPEGMSLVRYNNVYGVVVSTNQPVTPFGSTPLYSAGCYADDSNPQKYKIVLSNTNTEDPLNDGELVLLYVTIDEDIPVGSVLSGSVADIVVAEDGATGYCQDDFEFTVKVGGTITYSDTQTYDDGDFIPVNNVNVNVQRAVKADNWNTICLPFSMTKSQISTVFGSDAVVAEFTGCETMKSGNKVVGIKAQFTKVTEMSAHHPYLLKVKTGIDAATGFTVNGVDVARLPESGSPQTGSDGNLFIGAYAPIANLGSADHPLAFISNSNLYYATGNSSLKGFRGYFDFKDLKDYISGSAAASNLSLFVDGEEATSIEGVTTNNLPIEGVFDLQGRKVEIGDKGLDALQKGIYIVNGKKVTVK